jgi:hypothetical protein
MSEALAVKMTVYGHVVAIGVENVALQREEPSLESIGRCAMLHGMIALHKFECPLV